MYKRGGSAYITTNRTHRVLYTGATNDLVRRIGEHKDKHFAKSFSANYNVDKLVWHEDFRTTQEAFAREAQLKGGGRKRKEKLINALNPEWRDLYPDLLRAAEANE